MPNTIEAQAAIYKKLRGFLAVNTTCFYQFPFDAVDAGHEGPMLYAPKHEGEGASWAYWAVEWIPNIERAIEMHDKLNEILNDPMYKPPTYRRLSFDEFCRVFADNFRTGHTNQKPTASLAKLN